MAEQPPAAAAAQIFIGTGKHGVNKMYILPAGPSSKPSVDPAAAPSSQWAPGVVAFFVGDQVEDARQPPRVRELQDPKTQAALAGAAFRGSAVAVVMPSRLEGGCACFDHFLHRTTATGEPLGYRAGGAAGFKAAAQLATLLQSANLWSAGAAAAGGGANASPPITDPSSTDPAVSMEPVHLVGFSKGGVVLNQLLTELSELSLPSAQGPTRMTARTAPPRFDAPPPAAGAPRAAPTMVAGTTAAPPPAAAALLRAITSVHYVDAGLNSRGAYLTDPQVAAGLGVAAAGHPGLRVMLHGTPRQWDDPLRPWLAVEKNRCIAALSTAGVPVEERKYFEGQTPSLLMHFECIAAAMAAAEGMNV